jgi:starch-binding outer membrane protein, SusD/RagB family
MKAARFFALLVLPVLASLPACTDLSESPTSSITPANYYRNQQEVLGGLAGVYAQLRRLIRDDGWYYMVSEVTTDEMVVPTRGSDWYDNGRWLELHRQLWTANSPAGLKDINGLWVESFVGVARANVLLEALDKATLPQAAKDTVIAEVRALRAFYYYTLMDFFGGVPIVTSSDITERPRATRAEVFAFVETELTAAKANLPPQWPVANRGRMTQAACDAILASMYLNAEVWTGTVTAAGLQKGTPRWQDAIDAADRVLNYGQYTLVTDWRSAFRADNDLSPENIFVVKNKAAADLGMIFLQRLLHYTQFTPAPWNGFATIAETYGAFDANDKRREIFLEGPQVNLETQAPVNDRSGERLNFTPTIADVTQATEGEGVRIAKWPFDPAHVGPDNGNDFAFFRVAEMYLIKAEAYNELNNPGSAIANVNIVRARVFNPPQPLSVGSQATVRAQILQERLFEFTGEAKRRQDLIRAGTYTSGAWSFKTATDAFRILMPIPQTQLDANTMLEQNPGY